MHGDSEKPGRRVDSTPFDEARAHLQRNRHTWVVTGAAGFIGSNLVESLLRLNQRVVGLDNFATGYQHNLDQIRELLGADAWSNFTFIDGDIRALEDCRRSVKGADFVLHHAALGSVPRSIEEPLLTNESNVTGFLNMLVASRDARIKRFVYAASSSTYGDHPGLPKCEDIIGRPLSPYAVTKYVNELYADVFGRCFGTQSIGLRYFNIFGPRQDTDGAYAAVIPKWIASLIAGEPVFINGDGETSRDFCYVDNAIQANILAALTNRADAVNQVYNIAVSERTTLNQLYEMQRSMLTPTFSHLAKSKPTYRDFREGDVRHSQADISKAARLLGYRPTHRLADGLKQSLEWYVKDAKRASI
jgi:UDP-N-acetylglucosamine/UDP-N-acetylgalactosamine 4-epimerase